MSLKPLKTAVGRANAIIDQQYQLSLEEYNRNVIQEKELRKLKDKQNLQQYEYQTAAKEAQEQAQLNAYKRSNEVYEKNLKSINFYADTARSRVKLGLDEQIAGLSFQLEDLDRDFARRATAAAFGTSEQEQIIENVEENTELANQELTIEKARRTAEFDAKLGYIDSEGNKIAGEFDIESKKVQSENRYSQLNNQLEGIIKKGAAQARGIKGRSVNRVVDSIAAMNGLNTQRFNDSLERAEQSIAIQKTLTKKQRLSIFGDKTAEEGSASYLGALGIEKQKNEAGEKQTKAAANLRKNQIAETLGIDTEEFELSKEKLAESIMSAGESAKIQLEEIENKAFEAQIQSYAQRMLKPEFGPALPEPFKTPKTEYIKPLPPIYQTKHSLEGGSGAGYAKPQQPSGISTALGLGSAALAIAAPFTGGATAAGVVGGFSALSGFLADLFK
tara:strand:+ start:3089 stop:4426 length:1338 start_codon:yes stop_codon:yes gene_type:complete